MFSQAKFLFFSLLALVLGTEAFSEPLEFPEDLVRSPKAHSPSSPFHQKTFVGPNERQTNQLIPLLKDAPEGVHVSVGTERGFIGVGLNPKATDLVLVDRDPSVVWFNRVNIALLQMAKNRADYLQLRLRTSPAKWGELAKTAGLDADTVKLLSNSKTAEVWSDTMYLSKDFPDFHRKPGWLNAYQFQDANYLHYDEQFERVSKLAKAGKIHALLADLGNEGDVARIADSLKRAGRKLSVLDLSNAWWDALGYLGPKGTEQVIAKLKPLSSAETRLVLTDRVSNKKLSLRTLLRSLRQSFCYYGFCFDHMGTEGPRPLFQAIETGELADARLYSKAAPCQGGLAAVAR